MSDFVYSASRDPMVARRPPEGTPVFTPAASSDRVVLRGLDEFLRKPYVRVNAPPVGVGATTQGSGAEVKTYAPPPVPSTSGTAPPGGGNNPNPFPPMPTKNTNRAAMRDRTNVGAAAPRPTPPVIGRGDAAPSSPVIEIFEDDDLAMAAIDVDAVVQQQRRTNAPPASTAAPAFTPTPQSIPPNANASARTGPAKAPALDGSGLDWRCEHGCAMRHCTRLMDHMDALKELVDMYDYQLGEDDALEISRRQLSINEWLQVNEITDSGPSNLLIWPRVGETNILVTWPAQGEDKPGEFYGQLCEQVQAVKAEQDAKEILLVIDTAADTFGGNENIRREVNTFIKTYLGSFCTKYDATVLMLAHPSMSGMASGTGMSGSTAWENSVRARAYFSRSDTDDDVRILSRKKSNYSQSGDSTDMTLLWDQGVYQLPSSPGQMDRIQNRALKNKIIAAIDDAFNAGLPFQMRSGRKISTALPTLLNERQGVVMRAVRDLENEGEITMQARVGYRIVKNRKTEVSH